jgi:hypothetical protein
MSDANAATVQLYEDLTNILVTNVKFERSRYFDLTERLYNCVCTRTQNDSENEDSRCEQFSTILCLSLAG